MKKTGIRRVLSLWLCGAGMTLSVSAADSLDSCFQNLPAGCFVKSSVELSQDQVVAISGRLGAAIKRISNNFLTVQGNAIQVNIVEGETEPDAEALYKTLSRMKTDPAFCLREGTRVVEYVGNDSALAIKTSYELGFIAKPRQIRYRVTAEVAAIDKADYMAINDLFNQFLTAGQREAGQAAPPQILTLCERFQFGNTITLRKPDDPSHAVYRFNPRPQDSSESSTSDTITYSFDPIDIAFGVPYVTFTAEISVDDTGLTPATRRPDKALLAATEWWPVDDPDVKALAEQLTSGEATQEGKVGAILAWLVPGAHIKFGGPAVGSRWGVKKVLQQKQGRCWDFSDCFVTLCRASGIPCRQVAGWLYGTSGHVWAEVWITGKGWQQVDATGGGRLKCGIYHIPYFTTEDGEMPVLYVSMPKIDILETR